MSKNWAREVIAPSYSYMWESASLDDPGQSDEDSMETSKKKKKLSSLVNAVDMKK